MVKKRLYGAVIHSLFRQIGSLTGAEKIPFMYIANQLYLQKQSRLYIKQIKAPMLLLSEERYGRIISQCN